MIGLLMGKVLEVYVEGNRVVVTILASGVGYEVRVLPRCKKGLQELEGQDATLYTHQRVREEAVELYGFLLRQERDLFRLLIGVDSVGPQSGLALLQHFESDTELAGAIATGDISRLKAASGIGEKTVQKILLDLKAKLKAFKSEEPTPHFDTTWVEQVLQTMDYTKQEIKLALDTLKASGAIDVDTSNEDCLTQAIGWIETYMPAGTVRAG